MACARACSLVLAWISWADNDESYRGGWERRYVGSKMVALRRKDSGTRMSVNTHIAFTLEVILLELSTHCTSTTVLIPFALSLTVSRFVSLGKALRMSVNARVSISIQAACGSPCPANQLTIAILIHPRLSPTLIILLDSPIDAVL